MAGQTSDMILQRILKLALLLISCSLSLHSLSTCLPLMTVKTMPADSALGPPFLEDVGRGQVRTAPCAETQYVLVFYVLAQAHETKLPFLQL